MLALRSELKICQTTADLLDAHIACMWRLCTSPHTVNAGLRLVLSREAAFKPSLSTSERLQHVAAQSIKLPGTFRSFVSQKDTLQVRPHCIALHVSCSFPAEFLSSTPPGDLR